MAKLVMEDGFDDSCVMQDKKKFELWKEYYGDLLRETEQAYTQGATQQEATNRVEHWLFAKYADKFYSRSSPYPTVPAAKEEGARITRESFSSTAPNVCRAKSWT